jgi:hypothetical protein
MASTIPGKAIRNNLYGTRVERAAAVLPATGNQTLFTVAGGRVMVTGLIGEFTVAASATATNLKVTAVSPGGATTDLAADAAVASLPVGALFSPSVIGAAGQTGAAVTQNNEVVVGVGTLRATTSATNTGQVKWTLTYIPLDDGATVVAA